MAVLITYDVESTKEGTKDTPVKDGMKKLGYAEEFSHTNAEGAVVNYYLPNTTLIKLDGNPKQAKIDILQVAKDCGAIIERMYANEDTNSWSAIPGKKYAK